MADRTIFGYEILYRGEHPTSLDGWIDIDETMIRFLGCTQLPLPLLLLNLSNEALLSFNDHLFLDAASTNRVFVELSESHLGALDYKKIACRANDLSKQGISIAIDDFGAGVDGLMRYSSLHQVAVVKLDRNFLKLAAKYSRTRKTIAYLVEMWTAQGVQVIAEGVENDADLRFAAELNVHMVQGFFVDKLTNGMDIHHFETKFVPRPCALSTEAAARL